MICYKDQTWCSLAKDCANAEGCFRNFTEEDHKNAIKWWGSVDYPIALSEFYECFKAKKDELD